MAAESPTAGKEVVTDASDTIDNPFFARLWTFLSSHETEEIRRLRTENLAGLSGRVLEVGAGTGTNFAYYPTTVTEVVAIEPERRLAAAGAGSGGEGSGPGHRERRHRREVPCRYRRGAVRRGRVLVGALLDRRPQRRTATAVLAHAAGR